MRVQQMDPQVVLRALFPQHPLCHEGVIVGGRAAAVDGYMDHIGVALVHILAVLFAELDGGDGSRGGNALGGAHLFVELLIGAALTLDIVYIIQQDVKAHNINAVLLGQLLRNIAGGIGQDRDLAHNVPHFHSYSRRRPWSSSSGKSHWRRTSYTPTATLLDRFRLRQVSRMGIRMQCS